MLAYLPNFLSCLRVPLVLVFLQPSPIWRTAAILIALISDGLDGFLARRFRLESRLGVWLDPLTDKFLVLVILGIYVHEGKLTFLQSMCFFSRDFAIVVYTIYLTLSGKIALYQVRAIWFGKVMTTLQFFTLIFLTFQWGFPKELEIIFLLLGIGSLVELFVRPLAVSSQLESR